jgi:hypothetical protein
VLLKLFVPSGPALSNQALEKAVTGGLVEIEGAGEEGQTQAKTTSGSFK